MKSVNKVILLGNVTRDPEIKSTPSGQPIALFGFATNRVWKDQASERQSLAEFHNIVDTRASGTSCVTFCWISGGTSAGTFRTSTFMPPA